MIEMTQDEWLALGFEQGWCGPVVCSTHDATPTTSAEDDAWDEGDDLCVPILRVYENAEVKAAVEANHSPSVWRHTNAI